MNFFQGREKEISHDVRSAIVGRREDKREVVFYIGARWDGGMQGANIRKSFQRPSPLASCKYTA